MEDIFSSSSPSEIFQEDELWLAWEHDTKQECVFARCGEFRTTDSA